MRLRDVARVEDSFETAKTAAATTARRAILLAMQRQPDANTVKVVDAVRAALPRFQSQLPAVGADQPGQRPFGVDPRTRSTT